MEYMMRKLEARDYSVLHSLLQNVSARGTDGNVNPLPQKLFILLAGILAKEGDRLHVAEVVRANKKERVPQSDALLVLRILLAVGENSVDNAAFRLAFSTLGMSYCRRLYLDKYFSVPSAQRYYVINFVKLIMETFSCFASDFLRDKKNIKSVDSASHNSGGQTGWHTGPSHHNTDQGAHQQSTSRSSPGRGRRQQRPHDEPTETPDEDAPFLVGTTYTLKVLQRRGRTYREVPAVPASTALAVNPLYDGNTPEVELALQSYQPEPIVKFTMQFGLGCVPVLPEYGCGDEDGDAHSGTSGSLSNIGSARRKIRGILATRTWDLLSSMSELRQFYEVNKQNDTKVQQSLISYFFFENDSASAQSMNQLALRSRLLKQMLSEGVVVYFGERDAFLCRSRGRLQATAGKADPIADIEHYSPENMSKWSFLSAPQVHEVPSKVIVMAAGHDIIYFITAEGQLYYGHCAHRDGTQDVEAERVRVRERKLTSKDQPVRVTGVTSCNGATMVSTAGDHMYAWGENGCGQCLMSPTPHVIKRPFRFYKGKSDVEDLALGAFFGCIAFSDGRLGTWGLTYTLGAVVTDESKLCAVYPNSEALAAYPSTQQPTAQCCPSVVMNKTLSAHRIKQVRAGRTHAMCITERGEVFTWGDGRSGQLGHGVLQQEAEPRLVEALNGCFIVDGACGYAHTVLLSLEGLVFVCGSNAHHQIGQRTAEFYLLPVALPLPAPAVGVYCTCNATLILLADGDMMSCGAAETNACEANTGLWHTGPRRVLENYLVLHAASSSLHCATLMVRRNTYHAIFGVSSCDEVQPYAKLMERTGSLVGSGVGFRVVCDQHRVYAIGRGERGQLGVGDRMKPRTPTELTVSDTYRHVVFEDDVAVVSLRCGPDYVVAMMADGSLHGWGHNTHNVLSSAPDAEEYWYAPRRILPDFHPSQSSKVQVVCGGSFLVVLYEGHVYTKGNHAYCGLGEDPVACGAVLSERWKAHVVPALTCVQGLETICQVEAGARHTVALGNCIVYAWGADVVGNGTICAYTPVKVALPSLIKEIGCGPSNAFAISFDAELFVWGLNDDNQCGADVDTLPAENVSAATDGHCVITRPVRAATGVRSFGMAESFGIAVLEGGAIRFAGRMLFNNTSYVSTRYDTLVDPPLNRIPFAEPTKNQPSRRSSRTAAEACPPTPHSPSAGHRRSSRANSITSPQKSVPRKYVLTDAQGLHCTSGWEVVDVTCEFDRPSVEEIIYALRGRKALVHGVKLEQVISNTITCSGQSK